MGDDKAFEQEVQQALRSGDPEGAARIIMQHRNISLDAARKEVADLIKAGRK